MVGPNSCGPQSLSRLMAHINKYTLRYMSENLEEYGLSGHFFGYIMVLFHKEGVSERELTEHMLVDKATTNRAISKLDELGYIRKEKDPNDGRVHCIFLTEKGHELRPVLEDLKREWTEIVLGELDADERKNLLELLTKIETNLKNDMERKGGR